MPCRDEIFISIYVEVFIKSVFSLDLINFIS